jgi:hypothetical protein
MTASPVRQLIVAYAALTALLGLSILLPGNPYYSSVWGFAGAAGIQALIVWRLWHGSPVSWLVAMAFAALTVVTLPLMAPPVEVGVIFLFVFSIAQAPILLARPITAFVWPVGSSPEPLRH